MRKALDKHPIESSQEPATPPSTSAPSKPKRKRKKRLWLRIPLYLFTTLILAVAIARPMLPWAIRWYVNKILSQNLLYEGRIGDVDLHLWRGAYSIENIRLVKRAGNVPEPLFRCKELELAIQWNTILHGKFVGQVVMNQPEINFVAASDDSEAQTGAGGPWLQMLRDLFPFNLNSVQIHDGSIHFRAYQKSRPVDVYLDQLEASVDDLTNVEDKTTPLLTTIHAKAMAMDQAKFEFNMKLDPFSYEPTFELATRLVGLDVTTLNDLAMTYGQFNFKRGWFDLVLEANADQGQIQGYIKPLFRNLTVFDVIEDIQTDKNPLQFFWQALLGVATSVLKNQPRDQFGTSIPFTGDLNQPKPDILITIGNVLRNAFIRAYLPRLNNGTNAYDGMEFQPGTILDPDSLGDQP
jgi:hypothetical protein